jgi:hypothetical protein
MPRYAHCCHAQSLHVTEKRGFFKFPKLGKKNALKHRLRRRKMHLPVHFLQ